MPAPVFQGAQCIHSGAAIRGPMLRCHSKPLRTKSRSKIFKSRWFCYFSDQNEQYHIPLISMYSIYLLQSYLIHGSTFSSQSCLPVFVCIFSYLGMISRVFLSYLRMIEYFGEMNKWTQPERSKSSIWSICQTINSIWYMMQMKK